MSQQNQTQSKFFPRLNIDVLKIHAARWVAQYPDIPIDRIILYNYASKFQKYYDEPIKDKKYAVVFEISCEDKLYGLSGEKLLEYDLSVVRGEITPDPYYHFVQELEWNTSVSPQRTFKALVTEDFKNVYWNEPKDSFRNEWIFIPRPLVFNPDKGKILPIGLSVNVRVDEPNIILFESEQISKQDIPPASHFNSPDYFPRLNLNHLQRYARRLVDIYKEIPIKNIKLYRYSYKYQLSEYSKYAFFLEVDEKIPEELKEVYGRFRARLAFLSSDDTDDENVILDLGIDLGFQDVYKKQPEPESNYLSEWQFLSEISGEKMPREIMAEEPHWLLFPIQEADIQNKTIEQHPDVSIHKKVFPCKPGTNWYDVKITLTADDTVRVKTPQSEAVFSYHQLGFSDGRSSSGKPILLWKLLKLFAETNGFISPDTGDYYPELADNAKRLNKHLQKLFGIKESIYTGHYKKLKGYKTKIFFSDQTKIVS